MSDLKWMNWNEWIDMKELKWMTWHEWVGMNELQGMNWKEWTAKSAPIPSVFYNLYVKSSSRYRFVPILSVSSSKSGAILSVLSVSCTFCGPLSGSSRAIAETETLQQGPRTATWPEKTQGLAPDSVFSRELSRIHTFPIAHSTSQLRWWCDWHDDVVDMMIEMTMWLPLWWDTGS